MKCFPECRAKEGKMIIMKEVVDTEIREWMLYQYRRSKRQRKMQFLKVLGSIINLVTQVKNTVTGIVVCLWNNWLPGKMQEKTKTTKKLLEWIRVVTCTTLLQSQRSYDL